MAAEVGAVVEAAAWDAAPVVRADVGQVGGLGEAQVEVLGPEDAAWVEDRGLAGVASVAAPVVDGAQVAGQGRAWAGAAAAIEERRRRWGAARCPQSHGA